MALQQRLISVKDAAIYLGVRRSTLYAWAGRRKIPSVKMGNRLLFDLYDLDRLIETSKRQSIRKNSNKSGSSNGQS